MICPACAFEAPPDMLFCGKCGQRLQIVCTNCGTANTPDATSCVNCREPLGPAQTPGRPHQQRAEASMSAERRPVTVMFCDLVESTALSCRLDPEELREVIVRYQQVAAAEIGRYGGYIAQYLGDGLLVYFGYPEASEDSARMAVSSGLAIVDAVQKLNAELQWQWDVQLAVRVGIHSGLGVAGEVGAGGRTDQLFFGQTPNIAARTESLAAINTVLLTRATCDLVQGFFELRPLGTEQLKGVDEPIELFQAVRESGVRTRFELAVSSGLTPLIGRQKECTRLAQVFERACDEEGQLVVVSGEAGIGKSRLQRWLSEQVQERVADWLFSCCLPHYQNSALNPLIDMLETRLAFEREDSPETRIAKLQAGVTRWQLDSDTVSLFAALLSVPENAAFRPSLLSSQRRKQETLQRLIGLVLRDHARQPVVFVIEDLHWADPSTLEFIGLLLERLPRFRALLILTHRPEFLLPWALPASTTRLTLDRLDDQETKAMIGEMTSSMALPAELVKRIVAQTDGVPIFVEELTRMIVDSGLAAELRGRRAADDGPGTLGIPTTLQASLQARLDRLGPGKAIAQLGSVLGRQFRYDYLAAVCDLDEDTLHFHLQHLVDAGLFHAAGPMPQAVYTFKHYLVQDAAYESMLRRRRRQVHERVAEVIREQFPEMAELEPEILSHHLEAGGHPEEAAGYRCSAGKRALERSAYIEAIRHLERGLTLIEGLAQRKVPRPVELELLLSLGLGLIATQGYAAERVASTYARAMSVCEQAGDIPFQARYGIWAVAIVRGDRDATTELASWYLEQVKSAAEPTTTMMSHAALGTWAFYRGRYTLAKEHLDQAIVLFDPAQHRFITREYAAGGAFFGHMVTTLLLWFTGHPDAAKIHQDRVIRLAETLDDPYTLTMAVLYGANLSHEIGDVEGVRVAAERARQTLAESQDDFLFLAAIIQIIEGWANVHQGRIDDGIALVQQGLDFYHATGARILVPYYSAYLAEALLFAGRPSDGLPIVEHAIALSDRNLDSFYGPELMRLRGELLRSIGPDHGPAELSFREAFALARSQGSSSLELRIACSLSRLLTDRGRAAEAMAVLEPVYSQFTEGFETRDLQQARVLLARHSTTSPGTPA